MTLRFFFAVLGALTAYAEPFDDFYGTPVVSKEPLTFNRGETRIHLDDGHKAGAWTYLFARSCTISLPDSFVSKSASVTFPKGTRFTVTSTSESYWELHRNGAHVAFGLSTIQKGEEVTLHVFCANGLHNGYLDKSMIAAELGNFIVFLPRNEIKDSPEVSKSKNKLSFPKNADRSEGKEYQKSSGKAK